MDLSQVMPSGCNLRRVAHPPQNQLAVADRPSASDYQEEESVVDPADLHMALVTPAFQPYRCATGRAWMAQEYGIAVDTSSLLSSGTERDNTDDEICSFDLGPEPFDPSARPRPALQPPRPRASSVPRTPKPAKRMAISFQPVTETVTPPISPPRAHAVDRQIDPDTPSPIQKAGRSRGRGTWCTPQKTAPRVGTRSKTRQAELEQIENTLAQAARTEWPPSPDPTMDIQHMTRELRLRDVPMDAHKELQRILPTLDQNQNLLQPPAAGLMTQHQDVFFIPPPRVVGGAKGTSAPVSTAMLGLIHRHDPSLAAQLRENPATLAIRATRLRVYSTMRLIRTGMLGQLASLQQWEEAMHRQDDQ